jgi:uncharacterized protein (DUF362 family)
MSEINVAIARAQNYDPLTVKKALTEAFDLLGFNKENPLGGIIKPGMNVFIKPNWVASRWRASCAYAGDIYSVITHPALIECVADYVALSLQGRGSITIGDNPSIDADFNELMELTGIKKLESKYDVPCKILDLRPLVCTDLRFYGQKSKMERQQGDPLGYKEVNLSADSMFYGIRPNLFRGVFNDRRETVQSHRGKNQFYSFSRSIYDSDVYISLPKMKTHHKAGVTLNLKGLVGTISLKNELVHWRVGFPFLGGDEYPDFWSWLKGYFKKVKERGAWPGNDTIWRMVVDLYNAFRKKERKYLSIVDGVIAGEGKGPFCPRRKDAGVIVAGEDLACVDIVTTRLMGFLPERIKYLNYIIESSVVNVKEIRVATDMWNSDNFFESNSAYLNFIAPEKWEGVTIKSIGD